MRILAAALLAACPILASCDSAPAKPAVTVTEARITLPAVKGRPGAGYFSAKATVLPDAIVAVTAPAPTRIEMHESMDSGGTMSMRAIPSAPFAKNELAFEPGGMHLMLFDIDPAMQVGDTIPLTFRFTTAPPVTVEAEVLGPGQGHAGH